MSALWLTAYLRFAASKVSRREPQARVPPAYRGQSDSAQAQESQHNPQLITTIAKKDFPPGVKVGGHLQGRGEDGQEHVFTVTKIKGDTVHLDGNHPLAGQTLTFGIKVVDVRAATAEEIAHKHVHGEHGHHH